MRSTDMNTTCQESRLNTQSWQLYVSLLLCSFEWVVVVVCGYGGNDRVRVDSVAKMNIREHDRNG